MKLKNISVLKFTSNEEAIFLGNLLGDGHIQKRGNSFRTKISHCAAQKEYVFWKYAQLKRLCDKNHPPKLVLANRSTKLNGLRKEENYFFYLNSGIYLKKYHDLFYKPYIWKPNTSSSTAPVRWLPSDANPQELEKGEKIKYKKVITSDLINYLDKNPLILAVWFLDDGSCRKDVFSGRFATQGFRKDELHLLKRYLEQQFGIRSQIVLHNRIKKQYYLSIPSKDKQFEKFVQIIKPIVDKLPTMAYKISNPRND